MLRKYKWFRRITGGKWYHIITDYKDLEGNLNTKWIWTREKPKDTSRIGAIEKYDTNS